MKNLSFGARVASVALVPSHLLLSICLMLSSCTTALKNPLKVKVGMSEDAVLAAEGKPQHSFTEPAGLIYVYERSYTVCVVLFDALDQVIDRPDCRTHEDLYTNRNNILESIKKRAEVRQSASLDPNDNDAAESEKLANLAAAPQYDPLVLGPRKTTCDEAAPVADLDCKFSCVEGRWLQNCGSPNPLPKIKAGGK